MHIGRALTSAYTQVGSDWCRYCSYGHHHGGIDEATYITDMIQSKAIVVVFGSLVAFSFILFTVVIAKNMIHSRSIVIVLGVLVPFVFTVFIYNRHCERFEAKTPGA